MTFGMILLLAVVACSLAGSLIPQGRQAMDYVKLCGETAARGIVLLRLDHIFSTPGFAALLLALCLNLTLCSLMRFRGVRAAGETLRARAMRAEAVPLSSGQREKLLDLLHKRRFREEEREGALLFTRGRLGFFGSFFTHLSILLTLATGAAALLCAEVTDQVVLPGQSLTLADGTVVEVLSFHINDASGKLDYASTLRMTAPDGQTREGEIRVNQPMRLGAYKVYQQTYGTAGSVKITNNLTGGSEVMTLTEPCMLTLDGRNGLFYRALYPGLVQGADGNVTLITSTEGGYADPVYDVLSVAEGEAAPVLAFPGETLTIGDVSYTMLSPVEYPGLRIKRLSGTLLGLMYAAFAFMVAALYLCFFLSPVCVCVRPDGWALCSPRPQAGLLLEIEEACKE